MPSEVVMPRLGWTMEVGRVVEWLKQDGDPVEVGDLILAIESDKAINEVEAFDSGILRIPADPQIGVELPVGAPLGFIVQPGEPDPFANAQPQTVAMTASAAPAASEETGFDTPATETNPVAANGAIRSVRGEAAISPRARKLAEANGIAWSSLQGSGSSGRIREADIRAALASQPTAHPTRATPTVRRLAEENGIDLAAVRPSRVGGRITRSDVLSAVRPTENEAAAAIGPIRRVIIERMTESARTVAPVTLTTDVDAGELVRVRSLFKKEIDGSAEPVPSYNDILIRLVALNLLDHAALNASLTERGIVQHAAVHVGLAVDTERGLLAPVVRDADRKSVHQIAAETAELIPAVQGGTAPAEQLRGSTFTITNLGPFGIDAFTPIVNLPECAILGVGRIQSRAVVIDEESGEIAARKMMALSLTFDHRVVDGAPAARFLQDLTRKIERPFTWLTR
jgi:pyruvate dehydrogenase E2 component (dihydrolipoamide acetyltransferase)